VYLQNINGGQNCAENHDSCASFPCLYGGTCEDTLLGFQCHCVTGTAGQFCEVNIDDCTQSTCLNGGRCVDGECDGSSV